MASKSMRWPGKPRHEPERDARGRVDVEYPVVGGNHGGFFCLDAPLPEAGVEVVTVDELGRAGMAGVGSRRAADESSDAGQCQQANGYA